MKKIIAALCAIVLIPSHAIAAPGGRLTLVSGQPAMTADAISSTVWYTPDVSDTAEVFDGTNMTPVRFTASATDQVGLALDASFLAAGAAADVMLGVDGYGNPFLCAASFDATPLPFAKITPAAVITTGTGATGWARASASADGVESQTAAVGARLSPSNNGGANYVGQDLGAPKIIRQVKIFYPSNDYLRGDGVSPIPLVLEASNDNSTWRPIYSANVTNSVAGILTLTPPSGLNITAAFRYFRVGVTGNGFNAINNAEVEFFEDDTTSRAKNLIRRNGILVNDASESCDTGPSTHVTCASNRCTYLGSILAASAGTIRCDFSYGPSRQCGVWNPYNQRRKVLKAGLLASPNPCDSVHFNCYLIPTAIPAWGPAAGDTGNSLTVFTGLAQDGIEVAYRQTFYLNVIGTSSAQYQTSIGFNSSDTPTMPWSSNTTEKYNYGNVGISHGATTNVNFIAPPIQGANVFTALEDYGGSSGTVSAWSGERDMALTVEYDY